MSTIVIVSDDDDDDDIAFVGAKNPLPSRPISVCSSDDELPDIHQLLRDSLGESSKASQAAGHAASSRRARTQLSPGCSTSMRQRVTTAESAARPSPIDDTEVIVVTKPDRKGKARAAPVQHRQGASILAALDSFVPSPEEAKEPLAESPVKRKRKTAEALDPAAKAELKRLKQLEKDTAKATKEAQRSYDRKLADVNKLRTSKNDAVREVHAYLSHDLALPTSPVAAALPEFLHRLEANLSELHYDSDSPLPGVIKFKRHVKATWDATAKRFIPLETPRWVWESTVVVVTTAEEIVDRVASDTLHEWIIDVRAVLELNAESQLILMIKGMSKYHAKTRTLANREFTAQARAGLNGTSTTINTSARPDQATVEHHLVRLQVSDGCFLVNIDSTESIEDWLYNLTADIALRPYKLITKSHLAFCPQDGVKKASAPVDVFELMLQEVQGITPSAAAGIAAEFGTFRGLMEAYETAERRGGDRAETMLQDCEIKNLRNGTANGRKLKTALSKRVYHVFRGEDSLALA